MKTARRLILALIFCIILVVGVHSSAYAETVASGVRGNLTWVLDDEGTLTISGEGTMAGFVGFYDPDDPYDWGWLGYPVKAVIIEPGATSIGNYAFSRCTGLTSVSIPASVTSIGKYAFDGCSNLNTVYIEDLAAWCNISFYNYTSNPISYAHNLYLNNKLVTNLVIPNGVTTIGEYAFSGCTGLTSVTIPDSVTSIGNSAFSGCTGLTSVSIPNSVTSIGSSAFSRCTSLTSVSIPNSVTSIGDYAFYGCSGLTSVSIPNSVTSIGDNAFFGCSNLNAVYIENLTTWCKISFFKLRRKPHLLCAQSLSEQQTCN